MQHIGNEVLVDCLNEFVPNGVPNPNLKKVELYSGYSLESVIYWSARGFYMIVTLADIQCVHCIFRVSLTYTSTLMGIFVGNRLDSI